jgi:hypothetical protein
MRHVHSVALLIAVVLMVAACGDDDAGTTSAATQPPPQATTTAAAVTTTTAAAATTTTAAPTTTTTLPVDAHPIYGLSWSEVWPPDGSTAVYRVHLWDGTEEDVEARFDEGVEFMGGMYDRLSIGTPEPGNDAMAIYLDRSEPWKLGIKGVVTYHTDFPDGPELTEYFDEPVVFDGTLPLGESAPVETDVILLFGSDEESIPATYAFEFVSVDDTVEVPLGTVAAAYAEGSVAGEELFGGEPFVAGLWLHPQHLIVRMTGSPSFEVLEIVETWTR